MNLYDLRIEYDKAPFGLSVKNPRFSWKLKSGRTDTMQKNYRIVVTESGSGNTVWDSKLIESDASIHVEYAGGALLDETAYSVHVEACDNHDEKSEIEGGFVTGIFDPASFQARMITHDLSEDNKSCPVFYSSFATRKKVKRAVAYVTSYGVYEMSVNGKTAGDLRMAPGWTSYKNRLQYQIYDITELIDKRNFVEITVGNGWYKGILGFTLKPNNYGDRVAAFAEIHVFYEDGSCDKIFTDENWGVREGQILSSEIYMGESVDTTKADFAEGKVSVTEFDPKTLVAQENEPVRVTKRLKPVKIFTDPEGNKLVDFGQNLTGVVELNIKGKKGQKVTVKHAETLDKNGVFYPETLRKAVSIDAFVLNGERQVLSPKFTFHGFRYAKIEGIEDLTEDMFTALVIHSDMEEIGDFECSNKKVNQLYSNVTWSFRDNFLDVPTDCPQRDERLGWMGDAQVFCWTASEIRNTARFYSKWMKDIGAESSLEKGVPHVVPDILGSYSSSAWSDAAVIIPWAVYQTYGDTRILSDSWQCMHEWVDHIRNHCGDNGLWQTGFQYGDWLALDKEEMADRTGATDKYLIANAYYLYVTDIVRKTAKVLGHSDAEKSYSKLYEKTLEAFRSEYYTSTGRIVSETQTGAVISLFFGLAREKDRKRILDALVENIAAHKNHLVTGFVGTPYLCHVLSENGAHDLATVLFMREDYPSWLYAVNKGATTIWERWNSITPEGDFDVSGMNSLNHYAYGSIADWMFRKISGIEQLEPGYKRFRVKPMLVKGIYSFDRSFETMYGTIESHVSCKDRRIKVKVVVPVNTTAELTLPEQTETKVLGSGTYEFDYATDTDLTVERYSMESTLGEILQNQLAKDMFEQFAPGMLDNPIIGYAMGMTLTEMLVQAPEAKPMYEAVISALNVQEKANNQGAAFDGDIRK